MLQKLREAALAYQIERQWSKDKILTNYLNNIYFGNGAYGIEAAARTYFGVRPPRLRRPRATAARRCCAPEEAALLAALISSPTAYDPATNPIDSQAQRNVVLDEDARAGRARGQRRGLRRDARQRACRRSREIQPPTERLEGPLLHRLAAPADRRQATAPAGRSAAA